MLGIQATSALLAAALLQGVCAQVNATGAHCVTGATYCGYILLDHQKFSDTEIKQAYCSGAGRCKPNTLEPVKDADKNAWRYSLYVCLPKDAKPKMKEARQIPGICEDSGPKKIQPLVYCTWKSGVPEDEICLNPKGDRIGRCHTPGNLGGAC